MPLGNSLVQAFLRPKFLALLIQKAEIVEAKSLLLLPMSSLFQNPHLYLAAFLTVSDLVFFLLTLVTLEMHQPRMFEVLFHLLSFSSEK